MEEKWSSIECSLDSGGVEWTGLRCEGKKPNLFGKCTQPLNILAVNGQRVAIFDIGDSGALLQSEVACHCSITNNGVLVSRYGRPEERYSKRSAACFGLSVA